MELNIDNVKEYTSEKMIKSMEILKSELSSIRTGRANTSIIESIKINVYNSNLPLNQLASINIIDASLININAWDKNNIDHIIKSIQSSDLGLNPTKDGDIIKLSVPPLSEERRKELSKVAKQKVEQSAIAIRNIRRSIIDKIKSNYVYHIDVNCFAWSLGYNKWPDTFEDVSVFDSISAGNSIIKQIINNIKIRLKLAITIYS